MEGDGDEGVDAAIDTVGGCDCFVGEEGRG